MGLLFLSLEGRRKGYERTRVTQYLYIIVYHVPKLAKIHCGIAIFSAQGMEKLNDTAKCIHKQHSNKIDACAGILQASQRQICLQDQKCNPRDYEQKDNTYWGEDIFIKHRKVTFESESPQNAMFDLGNVDKMTLQEVKDKLMELGITTRLQKEQKLKELLNLKTSLTTQLVRSDS